MRTGVAIGGLEEDLVRRDRGKVFEAFKLHDLHAGDGEPPGYDEIAARLQVSRADVGNFLRAARRDLRRIVLQGIGEYVADEAGARDEEALIQRIFAQGVP